mmetsp:Transcript_46203/g.144897  ORF Transcript_46203/g.144897 Transcript_46203/m.144897 type:complete len:267 (-) Transcript_46203:590-1390(-)
MTPRTTLSLWSRWAPEPRLPLVNMCSKMLKGESSGTAMPKSSLAVRCSVTCIGRYKNVSKIQMGRVASSSFMWMNNFLLPCSLITECRQNVSSRFVLRASLTLHLYTSSQPCGNATLKRWAKPNSSLRFEGELWENNEHPRILIQAREEGQVAVLVKKDPGAQRKADEGGHEGESKVTCSREGMLAPGTASAKSGLGHVMCCSDKIAKWNALGVQGALMSILAHPIFITSITVGRKFSRPHCLRAFCCRLQDFNASTFPVDVMVES